MRAGIIGCGLIGEKRALALPKNVEFVGCYDLSKETATKFASKFNTQAYDLVESLLNENLDFIVIATRHDSLATIGLQAILRGIHTFIEKPGAINSAELLQLKAKSEAKGVKVHIGYNHRYHPALLKAFEMVQDGSLGELMFIRARYGHGGRIGYDKEWRAEKKLSGGGELIDQGTHLIDLTLGILGNVELDYAATPTYFWNMDVEDNAFISLKNSAGNISFLNVSCSEWKNLFSMEIYGKVGKLEVSGLGRSYGVETLTHFKMKPEMGPPDTEVWTYPEPDNSWELELKEFIAGLEAENYESSNLDSSIRVLELIEEIYERTGR